jgi:arginyl-tRNA synthetase
LTSLGYNTPIEIDYINMVQILNGSEVVKMSKRAGTSLRIKDILEEMELDVFKYFLISKNKEQEMEIDINIAQQNDLSNPFYYSQYANARINQILAKYEEENGSFEKLNKFTRIGEDEKERDLLTKIVEFEDAIVSINNDREPSVLINYLKDLSQTFNSYYNSCKVISEDIELSIERLNLMKSLKNLYSQIFNLLGITPINKI